MKSVYEVISECEFTGKINIVYRGSNKREALIAKRDCPGSIYRSYYAAK